MKSGKMHSQPLPHKILVVDNENTIVDMCRLTLSTLGYNVFYAYSGEQAIELASKMSFDLAIFHGILPGLDELENFELLRQIEPNIIGIMVTEFTELPFVVEAMNAGFSGVLEKPLQPEKLTQSVEHAFASSQMRLESTKVKTLLPLYELGEKFLFSTTPEEVYEELVQAIITQTHVPSVSVMIYDEQDHCLNIVASYGIDEDVLDSVCIKPGEQIAGWVYENGKPVILNRQTQEHSPFSRLLKRDEITASISFPMLGRGKVVGVINVHHTESGIQYSQADSEMLSIISGQAVLALENISYLKEREQSARGRALLEQYVAPEVAELLVNSQHNLMDVGSVQTLTVLFADIRNFTLLVQHLPPQELRTFLNSFFDIFTDIIFSYSGTLDKFMGDAALAIFGAPVSIEKPTRSAVSAATEIMKKFEVLRLQWTDKSEYFHQIGLGVGVSRGEMFLGNVGSVRRMDFTVIGSDVNIAQRLASETDAGQILITQAVRDDLDNHFPIKEVTTRQLRGVESEMEIYSLSLESETI